MTDKIVFSASTDRIRERSQLPVLVRLRDRLTGLASVTPTNLHYRLDDLESGQEITPWTSLTPGAETTITLTASQNQLHSQLSQAEVHQLTVAADYGLPTQFTEAWEFIVQNITGVR